MQEPPCIGHLSDMSITYYPTTNLPEPIRNKQTQRLCLNPNGLASKTTTRDTVPSGSRTFSNSAIGTVGLSGILYQNSHKVKQINKKRKRSDLMPCLDAGHNRFHQCISTSLAAIIHAAHHACGF